MTWKHKGEFGFWNWPLFSWSMFFWIWWFLNLQATSFWTFKNQVLFLTLKMLNQRFLLCKLAFMLQWARPIWVRAQFSHITLSLKIENKKTRYSQKTWKKLRACNSKTYLKKSLVTNQIWPNFPHNHLELHTSLPWSWAIQHIICTCSNYNSKRDQHVANSAKMKKWKNKLKWLIPSPKEFSQFLSPKFGLEPTTPKQLL